MFGEFLWNHLSRFDTFPELPCLQWPLKDVPTGVTLKFSDFGFLQPASESTVLFVIDPQVFRLHHTENWEFNLPMDIKSDTCVFVYSGKCKIQWTSGDKDIPIDKSRKFKSGDMTVMPWGKFNICGRSEKCTVVCLSMLTLGTIFRLQKIPKQMNSDQVRLIFKTLDENTVISDSNRQQFLSLLQTHVKRSVS